MTLLASPDADRQQGTTLFLPVDEKQLQYRDWLTPPPNEEGALEPVVFTITPEKKTLGRIGLRFSTGEFEAMLSAPGVSIDTPEGLRVTRTPEGVLIDDSGSPYDLLSIPRQRVVTGSPKKPMSQREPYSGEYAWLSEVPTHEDVIERSHTFEEVVQRALRSRIPRTKP